MKPKNKKLKSLYITWKDGALTESGKDRIIKILFKSLGFKEKEKSKQINKELYKHIKGLEISFNKIIKKEEMSKERK